MNEVIQKTKISNMSIPNVDCIGEKEVVNASNLREDAIVQAKNYLNDCYREYGEKMNPLLDKELDKLADLESRHKEYYQRTLFDKQRKLQEKERSVGELFDQFADWVTETLTIQNNPYIRIVTVLMGVSR